MLLWCAELGAELLQEMTPAAVCPQKRDRRAFHNASNAQPASYVFLWVRNRLAVSGVLDFVASSASNSMLCDMSVYFIPLRMVAFTKPLPNLQRRTVAYVYDVYGSQLASMCLPALQSSLF